MKKAAKEKTILFLAMMIALASIITAPVSASSDTVLASENRVEIFLLEGKNHVGESTFHAVKRDELGVSQWEVALESSVAPKSGFRLGKHGDMPSPRPTGTQSHHGAMSAWMKKHFPDYNPNKAPAVLMPTPNHQATFGVYNKWRAAMKQKMGGKFDWNKVSESEMRKLSDTMFDAAEVPSQIRGDYWAWFERMKGALK